MDTVLLSAIATLATTVTLVVPLLMSANSEASVLARWAVFLWFASATAGLWYAALFSSGCW